MLETNLKLKKLSDNIHLIPDEFSVDGAFWFHSDETGGYEWSAERLGIKKDGKIVWAFDSGCSCYGSWESFNINECSTASHKEFVLKDFMAHRSTYDDMTTKEKDIENSIDEALLLIREDATAKEILNAKNAEIRRYLIKRIGYEKIKNDVDATVIHEDGDNQLLKFGNGEMYVKVKDTSTERDYLLFVQGNHKTCKSAIAWTFGLKEEEYNPIIES